VLRSRERRYAFVFLLLILNALTTFAAAAVVLRGWQTALLALFDVSAIVWLAIAAALASLWQAPEATAPRRGDAMMMAVAILAALVPVPAASSAAMTLVAAWAWYSATPGSALRRASAICFSLTAFLLWGRIALNWGAGLFLTADAARVGDQRNEPRVGNAVFFPDGTNFIIAPACSSLHGVSLALILWVTVVNYFAMRIDTRVWATLVLAVLGSIAVNGVRLAVIARNPHEFDYWHTGTGGALFGWFALAVIAGVIYQGVNRASRLA
jgi:exosortase/archaeosortase family protein